ncbi:class I mannose-6-phosphate isomerase [Horticoccus luteus]|uniref:Class I mannose-6-phosphate isomerase n=1 Tax=Horticoccus luteus TaxID=2862869 RepID=A0A8F9XLW3_9BACT|nr:type I phosphomannose isomerase catalytic subunit [Horticoccus luteus]QYM79434.1 class I mannose-6-phosphate isomerase [Horticoccus luteus]
MNEILRFTPLYQERVWGGRALEAALQRTLPGQGPIGESWEIVDRPEAQSVVRGGTHAGETIREVLRKNVENVMGPKWAKDRPFPILVKWLDCRERLSLQVHPPVAVANELKGEPKTENWYIAKTTAGAQLIVGLKHGVTREQFERAIEQGTLEECVHHFRVAAGDSILVHSGEVHAIDAGSLILEIQQNSDTTYRVYDWGRVGLDGKPRTLHLAESLRSINWEVFEPEPVRASPTSAVIADSDEFTIRRVVLAKGERLSLAAGEQPRIVSVVAGRVKCGQSELGFGENAVLPYASAFTFSAIETAIILVTENFAV